MKCREMRRTREKVQKVLSTGQLRSAECEWLGEMAMPLSGDDSMPGAWLQALGSLAGPAPYSGPFPVKNKGIRSIYWRAWAAWLGNILLCRGQLRPATWARSPPGSCSRSERGSLCRDAMAGLIAWRLARGHEACSANTGAYCTALKGTCLISLLAAVSASSGQAE
jgi:hypothetical protein